jgi:hypothetical protein
MSLHNAKDIEVLAKNNNKSTTWIEVLTFTLPKNASWNYDDDAF